MQWFKKFYDSTEGDTNNNVPVKTTAAKEPPKPKKLQVKENASEPVSPGHMKDLEDEKTALAEKMESITNERDFYYSKLQMIEALCTEHQESGGDLPKIKVILQKLYETEQEF